MTGLASIPPDGLAWHEWRAAMRALNPDADGFRVPECFVVGDEPDEDSDPVRELFEEAERAILAERSR